MIEETGKRRRSRIELGYYRTPDRFSRWRGRLCMIAILTAAAWLVISAIAGRDAASHAWSLEPSRLASKGPLAQPHALWDSKCDACHVSFAPINRFALGAFALGGIACGKHEVYNLPLRGRPPSEPAERRCP